MTFALHDQIAAVISVGLLGAAAFATVAPLQMWVLEKADGAGQSLASSFNIAAFNLGNALGAWAGGVVIDLGPGPGLGAAASRRCSRSPRSPCGADRRAATPSGAQPAVACPGA